MNPGLDYSHADESGSVHGHDDESGSMHTHDDESGPVHTHTDESGSVHTGVSPESEPDDLSPSTELTRADEHDCSIIYVLFYIM